VDKDGGSARIISLLTQDPSEGAGAMPGKASLHNVNHPLKALARLIAEEMLASKTSHRKTPGKARHPHHHLHSLPQRLAR
jgi:hypothetical protein